jgi:Flp pilus assembly protein TadB
VQKSDDQGYFPLKFLHIKQPSLTLFQLFSDTFMNLKRLVKHFPELDAVEPAQQQVLLAKAYQDAFSPEHKMRGWRSNMVSALIMTALCFLFTLVIRPALGMSQQTSAILLMTIGFPAYFFIQRQLFIKRLRVSLTKFCDKK